MQTKAQLQRGLERLETVYGYAFIRPASGGFGEYEQETPGGWTAHHFSLFQGMTSFVRVPDDQAPPIRNGEGEVYRGEDESGSWLFAVVERKAAWFGNEYDGEWMLESEIRIAMQSLPDGDESTVAADDGKYDVRQGQFGKYQVFKRVPNMHHCMGHFALSGGTHYHCIGEADSESKAWALVVEPDRETPTWYVAVDVGGQTIIVERFQASAEEASQHECKSDLGNAYLMNEDMERVR